MHAQPVGSGDAEGARRGGQSKRSSVSARVTRRHVVNAAATLRPPSRESSSDRGKRR